MIDAPIIDDNLIYFNIIVRDQDDKPVRQYTAHWSDGTVLNINDPRGYSSHHRDADKFGEIFLTCLVTKSGYQDSLNTIVDGCNNPGSGVEDDVTTKITITKIPDQTYCVLQVFDASTNKPLSGASVTIIDEHPLTGITDSNGIYSVPGSQGGISVKVSKNGYKESDLISVPATSISPDTPSRTISLEKTVAADYYYKIKVTDESGYPMGDVKVRLYSDFSYSTPWAAFDTFIVNNKSVSRVATGAYAENELFYDIKEIIANLLNINPGKIKSNDRFYNDLGGDSLDMVDLISELESTYGISIPDDTARGWERVNDIVTYVFENYHGTVYNHTFTTNINGEIVISKSGLSTIPNKIYARGMAFESTSAYSLYSWTNQCGGVQPSTDSSTVGITLVASDNSGSTWSYNYNFKVVDSIAKDSSVPVSNVKVVYANGSEILNTSYTNESGLVSFSSSNSTLSVKFIKDGFNDLTLNLEGSSDTSKYTLISLAPENKIRVVYGAGCDELAGEPAPGILISIGSYDDLNKYTEIARYRTHTSGYIDTIPSGYFTANKYYAIVKNYTPEMENEVAYLKRILTRGDNVIELPKQKEEEYEPADYVSFYDLTANAIKKNVNNGNQELSTQNQSDKVEYNDDSFRINVLDPDSITTYDIFESYPVMMHNDQKSVVGSVDMRLKSDANKLKLKVINRYSGYYNPIFRDILFYNNMPMGDKGLPFSNTSFAYDYKDKLGKFGIIKNMWFHKVNDNKDVEIINTLNPFYPLTGQYALDLRDYNIFESNWDMNHYTRQMDVEHSETCQNISSMKNGICMFGSKYLNVPEVIEIYGFDMGDDPNWDGEWNDDWITNTDACPGEVMFKEVNDNSVDFYFFLKKRILRFFYDKLKDEFEKYMDPEQMSFGTSGVEDDIKEYVTKNVLKLYKLERVRMFVRRIKKGQHNSRIENDYAKYLNEYDYSGEKPVQRTKEYFTKKGFIEVKNLTLSKLNRDDFDRKLVYNLRNGAQEDFGFCFILRKI